MALLMTSIRSKLDKINGKTIDTAFLTRLNNFSLLDKSIPRACCAWAIITVSIA